MTEKSWFWGGTSPGDASDAPYDDDEFSDIQRKLFQRDRATQGYIEDYLNELVVTNPSANNIEMDTGAALVDGKFYESDDASVTIQSIATPGVSTRVDRVVLRKSWAAQTVRFTIITGVEGAGVPSITQIDGVTWDVPIAQVSITTDPGSTITIVNDRTVVRTPLADDTISAMIHIETLTGSGASGTLNFAGIAATFRHLLLIGVVRSDISALEEDLLIRFNGDGGANYERQDVRGENATAFATAATGQTSGKVGQCTGDSGSSANHASSFQIHIPNYIGTTFFKSALAQASHIPNTTVADFNQAVSGALWLNTAAINQIQLILGSGNFIGGSSVSLYGIN